MREAVRKVMQAGNNEGMKEKTSVLMKGSSVQKGRNKRKKKAGKKEGYRVGRKDR